MKKYKHQDWLDFLEKTGALDLYRKGTKEEATRDGTKAFMHQIMQNPAISIPIICHTLAALITERAREEKTRTE